MTKSVIARICGVDAKNLDPDAEKFLNLMGMGMHWSHEFRDKIADLAAAIDAEFKEIQSPRCVDKCLEK